MFDVVTFGEAMVRLSPPHFQRLEQATSLDLNVGGAELNVAAGVTRFGMRSAWISKLPKNPLGYLIRDRAQEFGVDCSHIVWSDQGRAGLYFLELGADQARRGGLAKGLYRIETFPHQWHLPCTERLCF